MSDNLRQPEGAENIEQIRHLLFGPQMKSLEKRLIAMEERFSKELADLKDEMRKRVDGLETFVKSEFQSVQDRIANEQEERGAADKALEKRLNDVAENFERKSQHLEHTLDKSSRDLRDMLLQQAKTLDEEMNRLHEVSQQELNRAASAIRAEYVDRALLSSLFTETALKLNEDLASAMLPDTSEEAEENAPAKSSKGKNG